MLKKLIFQVDHQGIDQIEQEILFSLISDKLVAAGCLSVSNISGDTELDQPLKFIEVIVDAKIHNDRLKKCFESHARITNYDELLLKKSNEFHFCLLSSRNPYFRLIFLNFGA